MFHFGRLLTAVLSIALIAAVCFISEAEKKAVPASAAPAGAVQIILDAGHGGLTNTIN